MKKFSILFLAAAVALVGAIVAPNKAEAVPAFARQVGVPCYSCHYQHFPKLNAFGRDFKLGGFTQSAQDLIQDEHLSLSPVMNATMVVKYAYTKTTSSPDTKMNYDRGQFDMPSDSAILVGGRVGENLGSLVEFGGSAVSSKFVFSKDLGGVRAGITAFSTDAAGPSYGMELFNSGSNWIHREFNQGQFTNAQFAVGGPGRGSAIGIGAFGGSDLFFANLSLFGPATPSADTGTDLSMYYRVAITPKVGDMDLMVGVQGTGGSTKVVNIAGDPGTNVVNTANGGTNVGGTVTPAEIKTNTLSVDAQLQMPVAGMSLEVTAAYASNGTDNATWAKNSIVNQNDSTAMSVGASLGIVKGAGVRLAFLSAADKNGSNAGQKDNKPTYTTIGGWYALAQNAELNLNFYSGSGDGKMFDSAYEIILEWAF